jgi:hypothetical protein
MQRMRPFPKKRVSAHPMHHSKTKPNLMGNCVGSAAKKPPAKRKAPIPASLRAAVWNTYIGEHLGKAKCPVCSSQDISPFTFECGHLVAEANGGPTTLENLRPICGACNRSSGTRNMMEFKDAHFGPKK